MRTPSIPIPIPSPCRLRLRRCGRQVAIVSWCLGACTPLRDLSSYSGDRGEDANAGSGTLGAVVGSPNDPAPLQDVPEPPARADAGAVSAPPVTANDAGGAADARPPSAVLACDGLGDVATDAGGCYSFVAAGASWAEASAACAVWGGGLVRVDSAAEEAFVLQGTSGDTWLGLSDSETEGAMRWNDGAALGTYSNWAAEQPDDFDGTEDCVELLADGRGWNDRPCTDLRVYVCER